VVNTPPGEHFCFLFVGLLINFHDFDTWWAHEFDYEGSHRQNSNLYPLSAVRSFLHTVVIIKLPSAKSWFNSGLA